MKKTHLAFLCSLCGLLAGPALAQPFSGGTCSASVLSGAYSLVFNGRIILPNGGLSATFDGVGTATFDGVNKVTFAGTDNTNAAVGQTFSYAGTYTLPSNCLGTISFTKGSSATLALLVWSAGAQFDISGTDAATGTTPAFVYGGNGSNAGPPACATASVSGPYTYLVQGAVLSGTVETDAANESGTFQFDGQGNVTASSTLDPSQSAATSITATGAYSVATNCLGSATMTDTAGKSKSINFSVAGNHGENLRMIESSAVLIASGAARSAFTNPSQSIANVANYAYSATPAGSVFALFGVNLAPRSGTATNVPLPTVLQTTSVTVNGELAPLFFVGTGQIDAQMPWDIQGNTVASVVVTTGSATSNAAAVYVPATGTPGLSVIPGTNRAVVVNADNTVNAANNAAAVGDEVVLYFTGGGPVNASGKLSTGAASPAGQVTDPNASLTVGGTSAVIKYLGLTPGSVGLYQANFIVPQVAKGTYPVVVTISGQASNTLLGAQNPSPVMTVSN